MKKTFCWALAAVFAIALLVGCEPPAETAESPSTETAESLPTESAQEPAAEPTAESAVPSLAESAVVSIAGPADEPEAEPTKEYIPQDPASPVEHFDPSEYEFPDPPEPVLPFQASYSDLSFLNDEQRAAYDFVWNNYHYLTYGNDMWRGYRDENNQSESVQIGEYTYNLSGYNLHMWEDFHAYWTSGFEAEYFDRFLAAHPVFAEHDGKAWVLGGGASGNNIGHIEGYHIASMGEGYIDFYIQCYHFADMGWSDYGSQSFVPMTLSLTEDGWRCSYFGLLWQV